MDQKLKVIFKKLYFIYDIKHHDITTFKNLYHFFTENFIEVCGAFWSYPLQDPTSISSLGKKKHHPHSFMLPPFFVKTTDPC